MSQEQRRELRASTDRNILIKLSDGSQVQARMINLSGGGVGICYPAPADVGTRLNLILPLGYDKQQHLVAISGTVRHSHLRNGMYFIGIEFNELAEEQKLHLAKFLKHKETHRASQHGMVVSYRNK